MEYRDTKRLIDAYLNHELSLEQSKKVESHLVGFKTCRSKFAPMLELLNSPEPITVPDGLGERIVTAIHKTSAHTKSISQDDMEQKRRARFTWALWSVAIAASLAFFSWGRLPCKW